MDADSFVLARLLLMAALTAATAEYVEVMKRRAVRRVGSRDRARFEENALHGLVRVLLVDAPQNESPLSEAPHGVG
jgi:hypothetical protein